MKIEKAGLQDTGTFLSIFLDYINLNPQLKEFYRSSPGPESFSTHLKDRAFPVENRKILSEVLNGQYAELEKSEALSHNLKVLGESKTFTVVTGHQLNIFTGPLYFIYKIATTIKLCRLLKELHPENNFIPLYWMASEDHDFEEINHFHLFGQTYRWDTDQTGCVGRFDPIGLKTILDQLPERSDLFERAYLKHSTLGEATRYFVNELFGPEGLIVIETDDARFKRQFDRIIRDELLNHRVNDIVESTSSKLAELGYKTQVHPRSINFFYLDRGIRERLFREDGRFKVRNTDLSFTEPEILTLLEEHPERFSPNVIMRPLYQETILPNLAYVGGPAEIAYWMQLGQVFEHFGTPMPVLVPRNFGLIINKGIAQKTAKLGLNYSDLFLPIRDLQRLFAQKNSENPVDFSKQRVQLQGVFDSIRELAGNVDQSLIGLVGSEEAKAQKGLENLEKRIKKSEEQKHATAFAQIESIKSRLFPKGNLQERHENFLNFYLNDPQFLAKVISAMDPLDFRLHILISD